MIASPTPLRIALIGISGYGRIHLSLARECQDRGEAKIVAVALINPQEESENIAELRTRGCAIYHDYEEMLRLHDGQIDLCLIPTGIPWHGRMTIAALCAGANVLVEKPLSASLAEVAEIRETEATTGRFVAVGFQDCYDPGTRWLADALEAGAIGHIRSVRFLGIWPRSRAYFKRNDWAGRLWAEGAPVLDSPLSNAFAHFVMLSLIFSGSGPGEGKVIPEKVELFRAHEIESFDTSVATFRAGNGVRLWFGASLASTEALEPEIVIEGTAGSARWRYENEALLYDAAGNVQRRAIPDQSTTRREMMQAVLERIRDPQSPICTTEMAGRHTALIESVHRAAPIRWFPREEVEWIESVDGHGILPHVKGLDAALRAAFATEKMLSESGFTVSAAVS